MKTAACLIPAIWVVTSTGTPAAIRVDDSLKVKTITEVSMQASREFHRKDGKIVEGRILAFNPDRGTVTLSGKDRKTFSVNMEALSEVDQTHVREWHRLKDFFNPDCFRISFKRQKSKDGMELLIWKPTEEIVYEITLENRCARDLKNLTLHYSIRYDRLLPDNQRQKVKRGSKCGSLKVGTLTVGKTARLKTRPVTIPIDNLFEYYQENEAPIAKLKGIEVHIYLPLDGNRKADRRLTYPRTLDDPIYFTPDAPHKPLN